MSGKVGPGGEFFANGQVYLWATRYKVCGGVTTNQSREAAAAAVWYRVRLYTYSLVLCFSVQLRFERPSSLSRVHTVSKSRANKRAWKATFFPIFFCLLNIFKNINFASLRKWTFSLSQKTRDPGAVRILPQYAAYLSGMGRNFPLLTSCLGCPLKTGAIISGVYGIVNKNIIILLYTRVRQPFLPLVCATLTRYNIYIFCESILGCLMIILNWNHFINNIHHTRKSFRRGVFIIIINHRRIIYTLVTTPKVVNTVFRLRLKFKGGADDIYIYIFVIL